MTSTLVLTDAVRDETHVVHVRRLLVVGFSGRDADAVAHHVEELAAAGTPAPDATPTLYRLDPSLVRQSTVLPVTSPETSGEVEPTLVVTADGMLLTVGSDHTDRRLERSDIAASKAACGKVVGTRCVRVEDVADWDAVALRSDVDGDETYQRGTLAELLPLDALLAHLAANGVEPTEGDVVLLGTVPTIGGIRPAGRFHGLLALPGGRVRLELAYDVVDLSSSGRPTLAKPELEFHPAADTAWTQIEGVPGQAERILAADPTTGVATRMLRFDPGADVSHVGVLRHDFWEEVYVLEGDLHDLTLDQVFGPGDYACRPPGMPHGPWRSETGCTTFEVRYPAM